MFHSNIIILHVDINKAHVNINMLHIEINMVHGDINLLHVACWHKYVSCWHKLSGIWWCRTSASYMEGRSIYATINNIVVDRRLSIKCILKLQLGWAFNGSCNKRVIRFQGHLRGPISFRFVAERLTLKLSLLLLIS